MPRRRKSETKTICPPIYDNYGRRIKRIVRSSALSPKVDAWVNREATRFNCSKSLIVVNALAMFAGFDPEL